MEMPNNLFGGLKVMIQPDYKKYSNELRPVRRSFGIRFARNIRRKRFIGWANLLKDGEVIQDKVNRTLIMNPRTKEQFVTHIANRRD